MGLYDGEILTLNTPEQARSFLERLDDMGFGMLYNDWLQQIWLYENDPPNTEEALEAFSAYSLASDFKKAFIDGDYKRIVFGAGATIDEAVLRYQMETGMLHAAIISKRFHKLPQVVLSTVLPDTLSMQSFPIYLMRGIAPFDSDKPQTANWTFPTFLSDGDLCHIIHVRGISNDRKFIVYDEFWWKGNRGNSFFCKGENSGDTSAELIDPFWNTFKVSIYDFWKFFVGFTLPRSGLNNWAFCVHMTKENQLEYSSVIQSYDPFDIVRRANG